MKKRILCTVLVVMMLLASVLCFASCDMETPVAGSQQDVNNTINAANNIQHNQPTPTDISYSLERYNLIRRAYWVNGQREKANALPCEVEKPLGYVVLFSGNVVVGNFVVDGKVSSLNSFLTPDSEYYEYSGGEYSKKNNWLADPCNRYNPRLPLHSWSCRWAGILHRCTSTGRSRNPYSSQWDSAVPDREDNYQSSCATG